MQNTDLSSKKISTGEKAKLAILASRMGIEINDAQDLQNKLTEKLSKTLGIVPEAISTNIEPAGRDLDMLFVINKQNLPRKQL